MKEFVETPPAVAVQVVRNDSMSSVETLEEEEEEEEVKR